VGLISHYIGTAEMIGYSYVWFLIDAAHLISGALHSSLYKHVNNAAALGTEEGYTRAGKYMRICALFNFYLSLPVSIFLIFSIGPIMKLYGYGGYVAAISTEYAYVAIFSNFVDTSLGFFSFVPDIEGHADFDAMFELVDSGVDILIAMFVIPILRPSLFGLGLIHLVHDLTSACIYFIITWWYYGWFDKYKHGIYSELEFKINPTQIFSAKASEGNDKNLVNSLITKAIPLTFDDVTTEVEWFLLTFFAAHLGSAEAAAWILISYISEFVSILPEAIASAFEFRVSHLLSNGHISLAKKMAESSMWMTTLSSAFSCAILFYFRQVIVDGVTNDETLNEMLLEIIPYIVIGDPILSVSTAASYMNRALAMYQRSTKIELLMTFFVTIPCATVSTYYMGYNIEGIAASSYAGYSTMALLILAVYLNADWDRAVEKNRMIGGQSPDDDLSESSSSSSSEESVSVADK
jgi:Na+-driven multidrug efflux pump